MFCHIQTAFLALHCLQKLQCWEILYGLKKEDQFVLSLFLVLLMVCRVMLERTDSMQSNHFYNFYKSYVLTHTILVLSLQTIPRSMMLCVMLLNVHLKSFIHHHLGWLEICVFAVWTISLIPS